MMRAPLAGMLLLLATGAAAAAEPAAIVEDAEGVVAGADVMDYVAPGTVIRLGAGGTVTIGYLKSCTHEVVKGGTVTIGAEASQVVGGQVQRARVECDGGRMRLSAEQAAHSGVVAFRRAPSALPKPGLTLYGSSPVVTAAAPGSVRIERLDKAGPPLTVTLSAASGRRSAYVDLAKTGQALDPGGLYRLSAGGRERVVKVDPAAHPGLTPLVGRLVQF